MQATPQTIPFRADCLTGSRFIAALAVLAFHVSAIGHIPNLAARLLTFGSCGVCYFFVLSGFVMTLSYANTFKDSTAKHYGGFVLARLCRIGPMHIAALVLITPLCLHLNQSGDALANSSVIVPTGTALKSWIANLFLVQIYVPRAEFQQLYNAPCWSVACEVVFYLSFPFLIFALQRRPMSISRLLTLAGAIWLLEAVGVFTAIFLVQHHVGRIDERTFNLLIGRCPLIRMAEFAVGCCSGLVFVQRSQLGIHGGRSSNQWLLAAFVLLALGMAGLGALPHFKLTHGCLAITPASAIAIIALAGHGHLLEPLLRNKLMLLLRESSYALYLLQWTPILFFRGKYAGTLSLSSVVLILIGCVAASVVIHLVFEAPICRWLRRRIAGVLPARSVAVISQSMICGPSLQNLYPGATLS